MNLSVSVFWGSTASPDCTVVVDAFPSAFFPSTVVAVGTTGAGVASEVATADVVVEGAVAGVGTGGSVMLTGSAVSNLEEISGAVVSTGWGAVVVFVGSDMVVEGQRT